MDPGWSRSCSDCQKWLYDADGQQTKRVGLPVLRPKGVTTPCHECPKIPPGAPAKSREYAIELSEKNFAAWQHYLECRAVGEFPDDPIVRRNARILRAIYDEYEQMPLHRLFQLLSLKGVTDVG